MSKDQLKVYIVYSHQNKEGLFGTANCEYLIDEEPNNFADIQELARDIEKDYGWKEKSVVILNWHIWNTRTNQTACPECNGRDILAGHPGTCPKCNGTGTIPTNPKLEKLRKERDEAVDVIKLKNHTHLITYGVDCPICQLFLSKLNKDGVYNK